MAPVIEGLAKAHEATCPGRHVHRFLAPRWPAWASWHGFPGLSLSEVRPDGVPCSEFLFEVGCGGLAGSKAGLVVPMCPAGRSRVSETAVGVGCICPLGSGSAWALLRGRGQDGRRALVFSCVAGDRCAYVSLRNKVGSTGACRSSTRNHVSLFPCRRRRDSSKMTGGTVWDAIGYRRVCDNTKHRLAPRPEPGSRRRLDLVAPCHRAWPGDAAERSGRALDEGSPDDAGVSPVDDGTLEEIMGSREQITGQEERSTSHEWSSVNHKLEHYINGDYINSEAYINHKPSRVRVGRSFP